MAFVQSPCQTALIDRLRSSANDLCDGGMKKMMIRPETELYIGRGILSSDRLLAGSANLKPVLIADETIKTLYGVDLANKLHAELLTVPKGGKALDYATVLMDELFKMSCGRDTVILALGGGATTDLVGFVASVYLRGVPLILIPTTLLAMVDAAIGGKTGVDTGYGKNLIGTIYPPKGIFADFSLLDSLPEQEWLNGLTEILKMGLIRVPAIWEMDENPALILKAIEGKIEIVEQDLKEQGGLRRILNFGHTIGHALETVSDYQMSHGEAVAIGTVVEAHLSMDLGYLPKEDFERIEAMYAPWSLQLPEAYTRAKLFEAMAHDKKKARGECRFVLIDRIGHAIPFGEAYCRSVTHQELEPTLDWMENWKSLR